MKHICHCLRRVLKLAAPIIPALGLLSAGFVQMAAAQTLKPYLPHADFNGTGTVTSWNLKGLGVDGDILKSKTVSIQYYDENGVAVGGPVNATVNSNGVLSVPPPATPTPKSGWTATVSYTSGGTTYTTPRLQFDHNPLIIGAPGLVLPGKAALSSPQDWFLASGADVTESNGTWTVASSNFDLQYTEVGTNGGGGAIYDIVIDGTDSYINLNDPGQTSIDLPSGSTFGTLAYDGPNSTTGTFDFPEIGMTDGTWSWDSGTNVTTAAAGSLDTFSAYLITVAATPEPSVTSLGLAFILSAGLWTLRRRRRAL